MTDDLRIRVATSEDFNEIMNLALPACAENGFVNPSPERLAEEIWPALQQHNGICGVVGKSGGKIEGVVLLRIGSMWYSDDSVLEERAIFVHPDFRAVKGGRMRRLCAFSKEVADAIGMPLIIGVLSNQRTEGKIRMYERVFGKPTGAFFLYGTSTGDFSGTEH